MISQQREFLLLGFLLTVINNGVHRCRTVTDQDFTNLYLAMILLANFTHTEHFTFMFIQQSINFAAKQLPRSITTHVFHELIYSDNFMAFISYQNASSDLIHYVIDQIHRVNGFSYPQAVHQNCQGKVNNGQEKSQSLIKAN